MIFAPLAMSFPPKDSVSEAETADAQRLLNLNGAATQIMETLTLGTFLTAFALQLGANNLFIGLLAAAPYMANLGQLAGVYVVERVRNRRLVAVTAGLLSRPLLLALPLAALLPNPGWGLALILTIITARYCIGAVLGVAWNSWVRNLIPANQRGSFFSQRLRTMTVIGMVVGLGAGIFIDHWASFGAGPQKWAYACLFVIAGICGTVALLPLSRVVEPRMASVPPHEPLNLFSMLRTPFQDVNFRNLMIFLASWSFAINLAAPFFTVHMFQRLEFNVFTVTALATTSQLANITVLKTFGNLADRFSGKSVMAVSAPLFLACVFAWVFTSRPDSLWVTITIVAAIHIVTGIATAGITIASTAISMRLAPDEHATSYLTANGLLTSLASGIAPVIGGLTADFFIDQKLTIIVHWESARQELAIETLKIEHWDFFFVLAAVVGLYSLHRLTAVREEGSVSEKVVLAEFLSETKRTIQNVSTIAGLRQITDWPFALVQRGFFRAEPGPPAPRGPDRRS